MSEPSFQRSEPGSYRQVWTLAYPAVLTMLSQSVMWIVDSAMVGHVGTPELAAVGLGGMLLWTVYSFFFGILSVVTAFVAQAYGGGQPRRSGVLMWQGIHVSLLAGAVAILARRWVPAMVDFLGPTGRVGPLASVYVSIMLIGAIFFFVHFTVASFFRGIGDTWTPLKILAAAQAANLVGDYLLIYGPGPFPRWGVAGAAWASVGANVGAAVAFAAVVMGRTIDRTYATRSGWRADARLLGRVLRVGVPSGVHSLLETASWLAFTAYVGRMGAVPLAASQIGFQILSLSFMPAQGIAMAATALVGQFMGARQLDVAELSAHRSVRLALGLSATIAGLCVVLPLPLIRVFNDDPTVVPFGVPILRWAALLLIFDALQAVSAGALRGAGDTRVPMWIMLAGGWLVFLPLAYLLGTTVAMGAIGAWAGASVYTVVIGVLMYRRLRREGWKRLSL